MHWLSMENENLQIFLIGLILLKIFSELHKSLLHQLFSGDLIINIIVFLLGLASASKAKHNGEAVKENYLLFFH